jgi:hypothetical protein
MAGAVHEAEQAVDRAREHGAPLGRLPELMQKLRVVSAEVDRFLLEQACARAHEQSFQHAIRLAVSVTAASTRIDYAASNLVDGPHNPRDRSIAGSAALEASSILDSLATVLMHDPGRVLMHGPSRVPVHDPGRVVMRDPGRVPVMAP